LKFNTCSKKKKIAAAKIIHKDVKTIILTDIHWQYQISQERWNQIIFPLKNSDSCILRWCLLENFNFCAENMLMT